MRWWSISPALSDGISQCYGGDSMFVTLARSWWLVAGSKSPVGMPAGVRIGVCLGDVTPEWDALPCAKPGEMHGLCPKPACF